MTESLSRIPEMLISLFNSTNIFQNSLSSLIAIINSVDWVLVLKVASVIVLSLLMAGGLFLANDSVFEYYSKRRVKTHHLTITNNGNMPSIFMLRTVDLPHSLAIRFRIGGEPMVRVTEVPRKPDKEADATATEVAEPQKDQADPKKMDDNTLIPNLSDPMGKNPAPSVNPKEIIGKTTNTLQTVGRKAGFFASIFGTVATLLPKRIGALDQAQGALKNAQGQINNTGMEISKKVNAVSTLQGQASQIPGMAGADKMVKSLEKNGSRIDPAAAAQAFKAESVKEESTKPERNVSFAYDEETWINNIGKVDETGGALNYAQSKVLDPGESMKVDLEIMNLSESPDAVSQLYKIEVHQIPQTALHLSAPSRQLTGIVIFEKVSIFERLLPGVIMVALVVLSIQIIAAYNWLIFR